MKVLVTGSKGTIGSVLLPLLDDAVEYDLRDGFDITDPTSVAGAVRGVDAVVHLAAIPYPIEGLTWEDYFAVNVAGTMNVAAAAARHGVTRFVLASSTAFYGAHSGFPFHPTGMHPVGQSALQRYYNAAEHLPTGAYPEAALAYACSKIGAETVVSGFALADLLPTTILRIHPLAPYDWGLQTTPEKAARAAADAVSHEGRLIIRDVEGL